MKASDGAAAEVDRFVSDPDAGGPDALPRTNGELTFEAPWEGRAFGLAVTLGRHGAFDWEDFRQRLIAEIAAWEEAHPQGAESEWCYYERWLASLEGLLRDREALTEEEVRARMELIAHREAHEHDHEHPGEERAAGSKQTATQEVT